MPMFYPTFKFETQFHGGIATYNTTQMSLRIVPNSNAMLQHDDPNGQNLSVASHVYITASVQFSAPTKN
jgi:hypothetical protein